MYLKKNSLLFIILFLTLLKEKVFHQFERHQEYCGYYYYEY